MKTGIMIRVLLSFLLLEVCVGKVDNDHSNPWTSIGSLPSNDEHGRRFVRDVAKQETFGEKGNYISTVIHVNLPPFSDSFSVGYVSDKTDKFSILFNHVHFAQLSSAYALSYRIDLDASTVQLLLRLGKAYINGTYCLSTTSTPNTAYDDFELNLYADLIYSHNILFHVDENLKPTFGKVEKQCLQYKKVKGQYSKAPIDLAADLSNYLSPKLLEAIVGKIYEEVHAKVSLDDVGYQIKNEIEFRYRNHIAERLKKAVDDVFEDVHLNRFNVLYNDKTNFVRIIQNFYVRIPSFVLRDVENFAPHELNISFVGEDVHVKALFLISSPLAVMRVVYCEKNDPEAQNKTVKAEYQILEVSYAFELIARPKTHTVELASVAVHTTGAKLASTQGLYGDERDLIIHQLVPYIETYFPDNGYYSFAKYIEGLVAEGRIAHDVFK